MQNGHVNKEIKMQLRTLLIASVLAVGATTPTLAADWDRIQSINFSTGPDRASVSADFGGRVEALRLTARESPMFCSRVTATFGNGNSRNIFSGRIAEGYSKTIDLPGGQRTIKRLTFHCHAAERGGGRLVLSAEYRTVPRRMAEQPKLGTRLAACVRQSWARTRQSTTGSSSATRLYRPQRHRPDVRRLGPAAASPPSVSGR